MKKYAESLLIIVLVVSAAILIYFSWQLRNAANENKRLGELLGKEKELEVLLTRDNERLESKIESYKAKGWIKPEKKKAAIAPKIKTQDKNITGNRGYLTKNGVPVISR